MCSARPCSRALEFRRAYDALVAEGADQADLDYVRILHLAASDGEECVRAVLASLLAAAIAPTYEAVRAAVRGQRIPGRRPYLNITPPDLARLRSAPGRKHRGGVRMSAATIARDETLELRLKALRLPSIPRAIHRTGGARSRRRLEPRAISRRTGDPGSRAIAPIGASRGYCSDAKLPTDKSVATLDLNRYAAPLARDRSANCCAASSSPAQPTSV